MIMLESLFGMDPDMPLMIASNFDGIEVFFIVPPLVLAALGGMISVATESPRAARFFGFGCIVVCLWAFFLGINAKYKGIDQDWGLLALLFGGAFWLYYRKKKGSW